jgi:hypothetical protein
VGTLMLFEAAGPLAVGLTSLISHATRSELEVSVEADSGKAMFRMRGSL